MAPNSHRFLVGGNTKRLWFSLRLCVCVCVCVRVHVCVRERESILRLCHVAERERCAVEHYEQLTNSHSSRWVLLRCINFS